MKPTSRVRLISALLTCVALCAGGLQAADQAAPNETQTVLPRLVDLGAGRCIPCRQMKPILDELKRDYATQFETVFIDVWETARKGNATGFA
jgi:thioredoxin 1